MHRIRQKAEFQAFRADLERRIFLRLSYDQQIAYCLRPENIDGSSPAAWEKINAAQTRQRQAQRTHRT